MMINRKDFIKKCAFSCAGILGGSFFMAGCSSGKIITTSILNDHITIAKEDFKLVKNQKSTHLRYVIVEASTLDYPIVLYRYSADNYKALLLRCTHQGTELNVHGDLISCPAHGSEFSNSGKVISGPAFSDLQFFPTHQTNKEIIIKLT